MENKLQQNESQTKFLMSQLNSPEEQKENLPQTQDNHSSQNC